MNNTIDKDEKLPRKESLGFVDDVPSTFHDLHTYQPAGDYSYDYDKLLNPDHPIVILHFNDVYNIEPQSDGRGGKSRFITAIQQFNDSNPLILFSGDAFSPSTIGTCTKGRHMVPFLNMLKVHTACVGNHEFDFGVDHLEYLTGSTRFRWVLSNIFDAYSSERPLSGLSLYHLFEWQGHRLGIIGLVEKEWIATLATIDEDDIIFQDFVEAANDLSRLLRAKECELIIALTHMRAPNDERLAREANDIDIILGGHDHEYYGIKRICNTIIGKSGTDFREFTKLIIYPGIKTSNKLPVQNIDYYNLPENYLIPGDKSGGAQIMSKFCGGSIIEWEYIEVDPKSYSTNIHVDKLVNRYLDGLNSSMDRLLGESACYLDTRFSIVRTQEANVGNWFADLMALHTKCDIAFFNSGTIRSDCIFPPGILKIKDLMMMLPWSDTLVVIRLSGATLKKVLEISVGEIPKTEGRFLQISGFRFKFDSTKPPGQRVISVDIKDSNDDNEVFFRPLEDTEIKTACTKEYLTQGKDGYDVLKNSHIIADGEDCVNLQTMVINSFSLAAIANGKRKARSVSVLKNLDTFRLTDCSNDTNIYGMKEVDNVWKLYCCKEDRITNVALNETSKSLC